MSGFTNKIEITMLPEEQWQVARIIHFHYLRLDHPCDATIVYFLPYEVYGLKHDKDLIDECILTCLKSCFGEVAVWKRDVMFDVDKEVIKQVFDGGRPKVKLTLRMTPNIPSEQIPNYVGKIVYAYDYSLNMYMDYLGTINEYQDELLVTTPYELTDEPLIAWGSDNIETL